MFLDTSNKMGVSCVLQTTLRNLASKGMKIPSSFFHIHRKLSTEATFDVVTPWDVSPQVDPNDIPTSVRLPSYAVSGRPDEASIPRGPEVQSAETIRNVRLACRLAREVLTAAGNEARPGVTTDEIDRLVYDMTTSRGAYPSPLNYRGFPKSVCTSVNNCVCHGIPDSRPLKNGDIINIDITVYINGVHGDCSETYAVGDGVDEAGLRLIDATRKCLDAGLRVCGPQTPFSEIGFSVLNRARSLGFDVVPAFTGHGIGPYFHGPPDIYHVPNKYPGRMEPGMVFTVEPVITEGGMEIVILEDGWTANALDDSRSAQFEHTILITPGGIEVLTEK